MDSIDSQVMLTKTVGPLEGLPQGQQSPSGRHLEYPTYFNDSTMNAVTVTQLTEFKGSVHGVHIVVRSIILTADSL